MGEFIGLIGGLLLFALVIILVIIFLQEINIIKIKKLSLDLKRFLIAIISLYIFQLLICAIIESFNYGNSILLDNSIIWKNTIMNSKLFDIEKEYTFNLIISNGSMPLYYHIIRIMGSLLFNAFEGLSLFIGFLCGISSYFILYNLVTNYLKKDDYQEFLNLLLLLPGSIFIFLPIPFSIEITLILLFIYGIIHNKNSILLFLLAIICSFIHLMGLSTIIIWFIYMIRKKRKNYYIIYSILLIDIILLVLGFVYKWDNWYEIMVSMEMCGLFLLRKVILKIDINIIKIVFIFINAYLLLGILLNTI